MTRIFVPQPIPEVAVDRLRELGELTMFPHVDRQMPRDELLAAVADQDVLFALGDIRYDAEVIQAATSLRLVAAMHPTATFVDIAEATRREVPVTGIPNTGLAKTTAEFTFALLLATAWRLPEAERSVRDGTWQQNQSMAFLGTRLYEQTLGIVGMGTIGALVAKKAVGCGMRVLYHKREKLSPAEEMVLGDAEYRGLDDLFRESDAVVVTVALTERTVGLVDARLISLMKPSAILVNTSRGAVLDEQALEDALREGRIRGAGLDVYRTEPPNPDHGPSAGLMSLPNVVLTPHMGSAARQTREEMARRTVVNIERFLAGERPFDVLNPEVYGEAPRDREVIG